MEVADGVHHVYARGNEKQPIVRSDEDRRRYLALLGEVVEEQGWKLLTYCLMPNHVHLVVETPEPNLGVGMRRLQGDYAQWFNLRHRRVGHLWQGRFVNKLVKDDGQLHTLVPYVAANPVGTGLCEDPGTYAWGSHAAIVQNDVPDWLDLARLLEVYADNGGHPLAMYLQAVHDRAEQARKHAGARPEAAALVQ